MRSVTACLLLFCGLAAPLVAQTIEVSPNPAMVDEVVSIRATGLQPNEHVIIDAHLKDGGDHEWNSRADFVADSQGIVDTSRQSPTGGSYKGLSSAGLIWAMKPADKGTVAYQSPHDWQPQEIDFDLQRNGAKAVSAKLKQVQLADSVKLTNISGQLHGILFSPNDGERHSAVLVVGGSEGGVPAQKAAWLAAHGYVALALAYFRYDDLPRDLENIPLEYFGKALSWLMQQPGVVADKIGVVGTSRGGELALQLASMYPQIKAVVAYVPANVRYPSCCGETSVPYAWTWQDRPLAYAMPWRSPPPQIMANAAIEVEQTHGPVMLIGAEDDGVWPSANMVDAIARRLQHAHFAYDVQVLKYKHAHRAGRPELIPEWHGAMRHPVSGRSVDLGGTPEGDAESSLDAIPKVLAFLSAALAR